MVRPGRCTHRVPGRFYGVLQMSELADLQRSVGRVEGKLDAFIDQMKVQDNRTTDLEVRQRKVENRQHYWAGAGTLVGAFVGWFAQLKGG